MDRPDPLYKVPNIRPKRRPFISKEKRQRTARLVRKVGPCPECRRRKLRCTHVDISKPEELNPLLGQGVEVALNDSEMGPSMEAFEPPTPGLLPPDLFDNPYSPKQESWWQEPRPALPPYHDQPRLSDDPYIPYTAGNFDNWTRSGIVEEAPAYPFNPFQSGSPGLLLGVGEEGDPLTEKTTNQSALPPTEGWRYDNNPASWSREAAAAPDTVAYGKPGVATQTLASESNTLLAPPGKDLPTLVGYPVSNHKYDNLIFPGPRTDDAGVSFPNSEVKGDLWCGECKLQFKTKSGANKHFLRHEKPFTCNIEECPRSLRGFSTVNDLHRHKRVVHEFGLPEGVKYICPFKPCSSQRPDKLWARADNFHSHLKRIHKHYVDPGSLKNYSYRVELEDTSMEPQPLPWGLQSFNHGNDTSHTDRTSPPEAAQRYSNPVHSRKPLSVEVSQPLTGPNSGDPPLLNNKDPKLLEEWFDDTATGHLTESVDSISKEPEDTRTFAPTPATEPPGSSGPSLGRFSMKAWLRGDAPQPTPEQIKETKATPRLPSKFLLPKVPRKTDGTIVGRHDQPHDADHMALSQTPAPDIPDINHGEFVPILGDECSISSRLSSGAFSMSTLEASRLFQNLQELIHSDKVTALVEVAPFTDSGYASVPHPEFPPKKDTGKVIDVEKSPHLADLDSKTIYSAATTVMPGLAQESISDVCKDIHARIGKRIGNEDWSLVSDIVPSLIKAFAIKLGRSTSNPFDRRIMHFVHQHHQQIFEQLEMMFGREDEDNGENIPRRLDAMSLLDKMSLWGRMSEQDLPTINKNDCFEGVDENDGEDEAEIVASNVSEYSKTILSNRAYDWLISSLLKISSFHWDPSHPHTMIEEFQQPILASLPRPKISRKIGPETYNAAFWLPWYPIKLRIDEGRAESSGFSIHNVVVLTGSSTDQIQATTVQQYFEQTWVSGGGELLIAIQREIGRVIPGWSSNFELPQSTETQIEATVISPALVIKIGGSAQSIAECGEQLAWLGAALQPTHGDHFAFTPSLVPIPASPINYIKQFLRKDFCLYPIDLLSNFDSHEIFEGGCHDRNWAITFERSQQLQSFSPAKLLGDFIPCSNPLGFPTLRRPKSCKGLEISGEIRQNLLIITNRDLGKGHIRVALAGIEYEFKVARIEDGMLIWHPLPSADRGCTCNFQEPSENIVKTAFGGSLETLWQYRHVFEPCPSPRVYPQAQTLRSSDPCVVESEHASPLLKEIISISPTYTPSPSTSIDTDMLSISEELEETLVQLRNPEDPTRRILEAATRRLLSEFRHAQRSGSHPYTKDPTNSLTATDNDGHSSNTGRPSEAQSNESSEPRRTGGPSRGSQRPCRKRPRNNDGEEDDGADDSRRPPKRKKKAQQTGRVSLSLACPFWKFDATKHRTCFKTFKQISYVKSHLYTTHYDEFYCERCFSIFESEERHLQHTRHEFCLYDGSKNFDRITHQQSKKLHRKSKAEHSEAEQWFVVWDIVFPNQPRPSSAYVDRGLAEETCHLRDFTQTRGGDVILEIAQTRGLRIYNSEGVEQETTSLLPELFSSTFRQVYDEWLLRRNPSNPLEAAVPSAPAAQADMSVTSFGDSAVTMGSYRTPSDTVRPPLAQPLGVIAEDETSQPDLLNFEQTFSYPEVVTGGTYHEGFGVTSAKDEFNIGEFVNWEHGGVACPGSSSRGTLEQNFGV